ncbi:hypothetical protein Tco_1312606 [Tanacetum coccineum]
MGDKHTSTIPETESNELIKSSVENLVPIPSEFEGIFEDTCDVPVCEDPSTFDALNDHSEILSDPNDDGTSSDDDDFEDIKYVSLEEVNDVDQEEKEFDLENILQIQNVILREKLLNINRLIANIESLNDNSTPNCVLKSTSPFPIPVNNSFFEKSDTSLSYSDNSLPEFESFSGHTEETSSGSITTHANNSLPEYDLFHFEIEPDQGELANVVMGEPRVHVPNVLPTHPTLLIDSDLIIRTFLPYFTYPVQRIENKAKTIAGKYEVQTDMSTDMSVRGTRWQAEVSVRGTRYYSRWRLANQSVTRGIWRVSVRGGVCQYEVRVHGSVPIMGNNEAVGGEQKDYNTLRSCNMSGGWLERTKMPPPTLGYKCNTQQLYWELVSVRISLFSK